MGNECLSGFGVRGVRKSGASRLGFGGDRSSDPVTSLPPTRSIKYVTRQILNVVVSVFSPRAFLETLHSCRPIFFGGRYGV